MLHKANNYAQFTKNTPKLTMFSSRVYSELSDGTEYRSRSDATLCQTDNATRFVNKSSLVNFPQRSKKLNDKKATKNAVLASNA